ncbi:acyltransferase family protein [Geodermatophilus tzadiensis]|nr:acyltransferase [Geodermatophilus tzadiensis]
MRALDGLRFAAAAAVVAFHYTGRDNPGWGESVREVFPTLSRLTVYGGFAPYLFFMISGFVVLMSAWGRPVHSFVASRVGRLFPAYWVAVLLVAGVLWVVPLVPVWEDLGLHGVVLNLTMLHQAFGVGHVDGVFWTLWVELKFYALLALVGLAGFTRERVLLLCLAWPLLGALAAQTGTGLLVTLLEPNAAPFFCVGLLLHLVRREGWGTAAGLLLGFNVLLALWVCWSYYIPWSVAIAGAGVSFRALAVLLAACVGALVVATTARVADLDWRWLTTLGALTYPLYLVHEFPGWVLIHLLAPVLPAYAVLAAVTATVLAVAYAVHRFVERPLGGRLRRAVERDLGRVLDGAPRAAAAGPAVPPRPRGSTAVPRPPLPPLPARRPGVARTPDPRGARDARLPVP